MQISSDQADPTHEHILPAGKHHDGKSTAKEVVVSGVPQLHLRVIARWCQQRVPAHVRDQVRVEHRVRGRNVTIVERRPPFSPELVGPEWSSRPLAQLRYTPPPPVGGRWRLYWADRHGRWHLLDSVSPAATPAPLLAHIDTEPTGIFWG